jgi:hypothetical protein
LTAPLQPPLPNQDYQWDGDLVPDGPAVPEVIEEQPGEDVPDEDSDEDDEELVELQVIGSLTPDASGKCHTLCQSLFLMNDKSLPDLIAPWPRVCIISEAMTATLGDQDGLVFD